MVKITIDLSKYELEMLLYCIESALDTKHVPEENEGKIREIKEHLSKYL